MMQTIYHWIDAGNADLIVILTVGVVLCLESVLKWWRAR